jgi:hypothetical protein
MNNSTTFSALRYVFDIIYNETAYPAQYWTSNTLIPVNKMEPQATGS